MAGINISFASDVRSFLKGTGDAEKGLEDVSDALDDVARDAQATAREIGDDLERVGDDAKDAGRDIDRGITDGTKDAEKAAERLERTFRDTFDQAKKDSRDAGDDVGRSWQRGSRDAGAATGVFANEARQNLSEATSSFRGEAEDIPQLFQDLMGGVVGDLGPMGLAMGAAAAVGIGLATQALTQAAEKANELTESAAEFAVEMSDTEDVSERVEVLRDRWQEVATAINDVRSMWEVWQPRAITNVEQFAQAAEYGNLAIRDLYDAFTDPNPERRLRRLKDALTDVEGTMSDLDIERRQHGTGIELLDRAIDDNVREYGRQQDALQGTRTAIEEQIKIEEAAVEITRGLAAAEGLTVDAYNAKQKALSETQAAEESYATAVAAMGDASSVYDAALDTNEQSVKDWAEQNGTSVDEALVKWEGASLTLDEVLAELAERVASEKAFSDNLDELASRGYGALAEELRAGGPEANAAITEMLAKGTDSQVQQFATDQGSLLGKDLTKGTATGVDNSREDVRAAVRRSMTGLPTGSTSVDVYANLEPARRSLRGWRPVITGVARVQRVVV